MPELSEQFVEECLDQYPLGTELPKVFLEISKGASLTDALLSPLTRDDIIQLLTSKIETLVEAQASDNVTEERNAAEILLGYLGKTKPEASSGLVVDVDRDSVEEHGSGSKYYQGFNVTVWYDDCELLSLAPESGGEYKEGKWVAEPVKWPVAVEGLLPLPELVSEEPQVEEEEEDVAGEHEKREQVVLREIERSTTGGGFGPVEERTIETRQMDSPGTLDLFR